MNAFQIIRKSRWSCTALVAVLIPSLSLVTLPVAANPDGATVVAGAVGFNGLGTGNLTINQSSAAAVINWQNFSINAGESTHFNQIPGGIALNRVTGGNVSAIYGTLSATGSVMVINPNGVFVGAGGVIDIGGMLTLSTLDIDNDDFLNGGSNRFYGNSNNGITNYGSIRAGGDALFLGGFGHNFGSIESTAGTVAMASGGDIVVGQSGNSLISIRGASSYDGIGVNNQGTITGAAVDLQSHGNVYALGINNGGITRATGGSRANGRARLFATGTSSRINNTGTIEARNANGRGGDIEIKGSEVMNSGTLDASAVGANDGGTVTVTGDSLTFSDTSKVKVNSVGNAGKVNLKASDSLNLDGSVDASSQLLKAGSVIAEADDVMVNADINATGFQRGGSIKVGGDFQGITSNGISASSRTTIGSPASFDASALAGDAGQIIVWSNGDTIFEGEARADATGIIGNGGLIEVSGLENLTFRGLVSASAKSGKAGLVLFDPGTLRVGNALVGVNEIANATINNLLQGGTSVLLTTQGVDSDIVFVDTGVDNDRHDAIQWTNSNASFGAFAGRNVVVGTHIRTSGSGTINLIGGWSGTEANAISLLTGNVASPNGVAIPSIGGVGTGPMSVQDVFNAYVSTGQFGANNGNIIIGSATMSRHVEVGSRYGDTNVAALNVIVTAADTDGESRHAQLGFRDAGQVFAPRIGTLDLNTRELEFDNDPLVGIAGVNETANGMGVFAVNSFGVIGNRTAADLNIYTTGINLAHSGTPANTSTFVLDRTGGSGQAGRLIQAGTLPTNNTLSAVAANAYDDADLDGIPNIFDSSTIIAGTTYVGFAVDFDGDTIAEVRTASVGASLANFNFSRNATTGTVFIRQDGALKGLTVDTDADYVGNTHYTNDTIIPYANHFMDTRQGNWWWQQIDRGSADPLGLGGNRPEMGAGSLTNPADINVIAAGSVLVTGGGRNDSGAYIGHGGDSAGSLDQRAARGTGIQNNQTQQMWSQNGAINDRSAMAIARLAPVYGNINVLAGVDTTAGVNINNSGNVTATITAGAGSVVVSGIQRMGSANNKGNPEQNDGTNAPAVIGHGGVGQFGEFNGDIQVRAGGSVNVVAGSNTRAYAQIGHNIDTFHYWDPPSNANAQIRFFANASDFNDPLLRRGQLFSGQTNIAQALSGSRQGITVTTTAGEVILGDNFNGTRQDTDADLNNRNLLSNPITGTFAVESLDGSVVSGFHGDVTVEARSGSVTVQGFNTTDTTGDATFNAGRGLSTSRDRRYAKIGHGGTSAEVGDEHSGYRVDTGTDRFRELVHLRVPTATNTETGAATVIGQVGFGANRGLSFMTITGNIDVTSGGNVSVKAGNDTFDFAQIGHGGTEIADYETSSFIAGNIDINAAGQLIVTGGGEVRWTGLGNNDAASRHMRSQAQVGHGGHQAGFLGYFGDINVSTAGNITVTGGAYGDNYAKIGHKGSDDWGQVGGNFTRNENFLLDGVSVNIASSISGNNATVTYSSGTSPNAPAALGVGELSGSSKTFTLTSNTTNISVASTHGTVKLAHLDAQLRQNANQAFSNLAGRRISQGQMEDAYAQIGHGGNNVADEYWRNSRTNYDDMVGNISVTALGTIADLILEGGNREGMWSRVGHGFTGTNVRVANGEELRMGGEISINIGRDVFLDGAKAAEMDVNQDQPAKDNGLAIGHGTFVLDESGRGQVAVLNNGVINGLTLPTTITVNAGRDISVIGGNGAQDVGGEIGSSGTHSQIGHGTSSLLGDEISTRGFQGDINVNAVRDILVRATDNGIVHDTAGTIIISSSGGAAVIGNGGIHMDAPASGDITVFAGNNLSIISPERRDEDVNLLRTTASFSNLNFAKIGHFSTENQSSGTVTVGLMDGDISVVVGNDLTMSGGRTPDHNSVNFTDVGLDLPTGLFGRQGVLANFSQIGHGGPGITGTMIGDIEVLVGNNLTTNDGSIDRSGQVSPLSGNNYVKIGHGDWLRDGNVGYQGPAVGLMTGDIAVLVGESADLEHTMIGHRDPTLSGALSGAGTTTIAVSRNFPFYTPGVVGGTLTATGVTDQVDAIGDTLTGTGRVSGSVFTSGSFGGDPLSIYIPERDSNFMAIGSTRLNTTNVFYHGNNGGGTPGGSGPFAGAADEVFLAPDLWWMDDADVVGATAAGFTTSGQFPTSNGSQGGVVATVSNPGGLPNLDTLVAGAMGSSTNGSTYRGGHGLSGGLYTLFYDAIEPVSADFPPPPPPAPPDPSTLEPFVFADLFDTFQRQADGFDGYLGGAGFVGDLPYRNQLADDLGVPNWFLEEMLDMGMGPRQSGKSSANGALQASDSPGEEGAIAGSSSDVAREDAEEIARRENRNNRVTPVGTVFYIYTPGSGNPYSSINLFGQPE